jgi:hypothetical protein
MQQPLPYAHELALLHRFEPVLRYTRGERFFPMDVKRYIQECSLWIQVRGEPDQLLVSQKDLTLEKLAEPRQDGFDAVYFVKFIDPMDLLELARLSLNETVRAITGQETPDAFHAGLGRLARVGYSSRLIDAIFSISLFLRGRVPGDTAAAAAQTYQRLQQAEEHFTYYGRVSRQNGWLLLQYWYFYPYNNWRSGFFGANDHEGDWEMITIYCSEEQSGGATLMPDACIVPRWLAYASHEFSGDDLRRRWDDPEVEKIGEHPVIYAGAGSHASYFSSGEYLAELEISFLSPLVRAAERIQALWANTLHQGSQHRKKPAFNLFRVPFVDYARGDGLSIGPGQAKTWEACLLNPVPGWVQNYRGLWGLYARDPVSSENAPAGPMYNRDGSVRMSWYNPVGWAGLDKVPPPEETAAILARQRGLTVEHCQRLHQAILEKSAILQGMGVEASAVMNYPHMEEVHERLNGQIQEISASLDDLHRQLTEEEAKVEAFDLFQERLKGSFQDPLRAHIRRPPMASSKIDLRMGRLAEGFSAVSIGLVMIVIVLLVAFARHYLLLGLSGMIALIIFIESGFRRQLTRLITSLSIGLAVVTSFVLLFEFFWPFVVGAVLLAGLFIIWENIREIRG